MSTVMPTRPLGRTGQPGASSPVIMRKSVVLPAPLAPITPTIPARGTSKLSSSISSCSP